MCTAGFITQVETWSEASEPGGKSRERANELRTRIDSARFSARGERDSSGKERTRLTSLRPSCCFLVSLISTRSLCAVRSRRFGLSRNSPRSEDCLPRHIGSAATVEFDVSNPIPVARCCLAKALARALSFALLHANAAHCRALRADAFVENARPKSSCATRS